MTTDQTGEQVNGEARERMSVGWEHRLNLWGLGNRLSILGGSCTHRARTVRSFDIHVFVLVTPGTDVFYNRASTGDRVPAIVLGSSPQPGDFFADPI